MDELGQRLQGEFTARASGELREEPEVTFARVRRGAKRRRAVRAVAVSSAVALVIAGASAGVWTLSRGGELDPASSSPSATTSPAPADLAPLPDPAIPPVPDPASPPPSATTSPTPNEGPTP